MKLRIDVVAVPEFDLDVAHYGIAADRVALLKRRLASDPSRGAGDPKRPDVRMWAFDGFVVRYHFTVLAGGSALVLLLRMQPKDEPGGGRRMLRRARAALAIANQIKALLSGWDLPGKDDDDG